MSQDAAASFCKLCLVTIVAIYVLILLGGVVRASGAGMGCPDWPKCFDRWIPPTSVADLPPDYQQIYADRGYRNTTFNPIKTWTEYTNRLAGVTIGILIFLTAWRSRVFWQTNRAVVAVAWTVFLLVCLQGWLGGAVVASNLQPFIITLHMLLALLIVASLIWLFSSASPRHKVELHPAPPSVIRYLIIVAIVMTLLQVVLGTQVREAVDTIAQTLSERRYWRDGLGVVLDIHRSFAAAILSFNLYIYWWLRPLPNSNPTKRCYQIIVLLLTLEILAGISLDRLALPPVAQPIHLLFATLIFGGQFFTLLFLGNRQRLNIK